METDSFEWKEGSTGNILSGPCSQLIELTEYDDILEKIAAADIVQYARSLWSLGTF